MENKKKVEWFKVSKRVSLEKNQETVDPNFIPKDIPFEDNKK